MMNIVILLLLVAVVAFGMGAWSLIIISRRSPKIYEIEPVFGAICSDLSSLIRNFRKLVYLTSEVTQGVLKGSDDSPKLVEAVFVDENQEIKREESEGEISNNANEVRDLEDKEELLTSEKI